LTFLSGSASESLTVTIGDLVLTIGCSWVCWI